MIPFEDLPSVRALRKTETDIRDGAYSENMRDHVSHLAPGCCSAIAPCAHQRKDPTTVCAICAHSQDQR